jgi:DNA-binding FadR family transcriptional regulator
MTVSGISTSTDLNQTSSTQTKFKQVKDDYQLLGQALQSGDLNAAQQAFAALQQLIPNLSSGSQAQNGQQGSSQNPLLTDLNAIGKALQSGDLSAAKAAFAKLQQDVQSVSIKGHHHRHPKTGGAQNSLASLLGSSRQTDGSSSTSQSIGQNINIAT